MPPRLILLVRHAQSEHHIRRLSGGWIDTPLTPLGHEQSRRLAARLRVELPDTAVRLYSSDLIRAQETARYIGEAFRVEPALDARLREHNNGLAANMTIDEVRTRYPGALAVGIDARPYPEAETMREFYARAGEYLGALQDEGGVPVLVSHGGTISKLVASWLRLSAESAAGTGFAMHTTAITVLLEDARGERIIERHNDIAHLSGTDGWIPLSDLVKSID
jgi:broad specificity phosphatase PhoE